jgi:hypothetical protein
VIETRIEGSTTSVDAAARWLRRSLKAGLEDASDRVVEARRAAADWEGDAGAAYTAYAGDIVTVTDGHVDRVAGAARLLDDYSARLRTAQDRMRDLRGEAVAGGLAVVGTVIQPPADAVPPPVVMGPISPAQSDQIAADQAAYDAQVAKIRLYDRIATDVAAEWQLFTAWVDTHLTPTPERLEAPDVSALESFVKENAGNLIRGFALEYGKRGLGEKAAALADEADDLRAARRSGNPARRALGEAPETPGRINDLRGKADLLGKGSRFLGPVGTVVDAVDALESDSPAGGLLAAGAGLGATALVIATAPVSVPGIVVVGGAVAIGAGATWLVNEGWDALPDDVTEPIDDFVEDRWDDTKDAVSDGWEAVTGWL